MFLRHHHKYAVHHLLILVSLLLIVSSVAIGCTGPSQLDEPVTIHFIYGQSNNYLVYYNLVEDFNRLYPHITAVLTDDPLVADVFPPSRLELRRFGEEDQTAVLLNRIIPLDLSAFMEEDDSFAPSDFYPGVLDEGSSGAALERIPGGLDVLVIYYNEALFDRYGIPYPEIGWSWDDFLDKALALRDVEAGVYGYVSGIAPDPLPFIYEQNLRIPEPNTAFSTEEALGISSLTWYADLFHQYDVSPMPEEAAEAFQCNDDELAYSENLTGVHTCELQGIEHGQVGMWIGWLVEGYGARRWSSRRDDNWGVAVLPQGTHPTCWYQQWSYSISAQTEHPEESWEFVSYASQNLLTTYVPARRPLAESPNYEQLVGEEKAVIGLTSLEGAIAYPLTNWDMLNIYYRALGNVVNGLLTPNEAVIEMQIELVSVE